MRSRYFRPVKVDAGLARMLAIVDKDSPRKDRRRGEGMLWKIKLPVRVVFRYDDPPHFFVTLL